MDCRCQFADNNTTILLDEPYLEESSALISFESVDVDDNYIITLVTPAESYTPLMDGLKPVLPRNTNAIQLIHKSGLSHLKFRETIYGYGNCFYAKTTGNSRSDQGNHRYFL